MTSFFTSLYHCMNNSMLACHTQRQKHFQNTIHYFVAMLLSVCGFLEVPSPALYDNTWIVDTSLYPAYNFSFPFFNLPNTGSQCVALSLSIIDLEEEERFCGYRFPWSMLKKGKSFIICIHNSECQ